MLVRSYLALSQQQQLQHDLVLVWGNPPQLLLDEIQQCGASQRIHFLKNISDDDLALLYNGAKALFFHPLTKDLDCRFWKRWPVEHRL